MFKEIQENYADQLMRKKSGGGKLAAGVIGGATLYGAKKMINGVQKAADQIKANQHDELIGQLTDSTDMSSTVETLNLFDESNGFEYRHNPKFTLNENSTIGTFVNRFRYLKD